MDIPLHINASLASFTMFSQEFHHICSEGKWLCFMFLRREKCAPRSLHDKFWLDENIEEFQEHMEYAIGPLACTNSHLIGFATILVVMPLQYIYNICPFVWCMRKLQTIYFHGIIITQRWNFFEDAIFWHVPEGSPPFLLWRDLTIILQKKAKIKARTVLSIDYYYPTREE